MSLSRWPGSCMTGSLKQIRLRESIAVLFWIQNKAAFNPWAATQQRPAVVYSKTKMISLWQPD